MAKFARIITRAFSTFAEFRNWVISQSFEIDQHPERAPVLKAGQRVVVADVQSVYSAVKDVNHARDIFTFDASDGYGTCLKEEQDCLLVALTAANNRFAPFSADAPGEVVLSLNETVFTQNATIVLQFNTQAENFNKTAGLYILEQGNTTLKTGDFTVGVWKGNETETFRPGKDITLQGGCSYVVLLKDDKTVMLVEMGKSFFQPVQVIHDLPSEAREDVIPSERAVSTSLYNLSSRIEGALKGTGGFLTFAGVDTATDKVMPYSSDSICTDPYQIADTEGTLKTPNAENLYALTLRDSSTVKVHKSVEVVTPIRVPNANHLGADYYGADADADLRAAYPDAVAGNIVSNMTTHTEWEFNGLNWHDTFRPELENQYVHNATYRGLIDVRRTPSLQAKTIAMLFPLVANGSIVNNMVTGTEWKKSDIGLWEDTGVVNGPIPTVPNPIIVGTFSWNPNNEDAVKAVLDVRFPDAEEGHFYGVKGGNDWERIRIDADTLGWENTKQIFGTNKRIPNPLYLGEGHYGEGAEGANNLAVTYPTPALDSVVSNLDTNTDWKHNGTVWVDTQEPLYALSTIPNPLYKDIYDTPLGEYDELEAAIGATFPDAPNGSIAINIVDITASEWKKEEGSGWFNTLFPVGTTPTEVNDPIYVGKFNYQEIWDAPAKRIAIMFPDAGHKDFVQNLSTGTEWEYVTIGNRWFDTKRPNGFTPVTNNPRYLGSGTYGTNPPVDEYITALAIENASEGEFVHNVATDTHWFLQRGSWVNTKAKELEKYAYSQQGQYAWVELDPSPIGAGYMFHATERTPASDKTEAYWFANSWNYLDFDAVSMPGFTEGTKGTLTGRREFGFLESQEEGGITYGKVHGLTDKGDGQKALFDDGNYYPISTNASLSDAINEFNSNQIASSYAVATLNAKVDATSETLNTTVTDAVNNVNQSLQTMQTNLTNQLEDNEAKVLGLNTPVLRNFVQSQGYGFQKHLLMPTYLENGQYHGRTISVQANKRYDANHNETVPFANRNGRVHQGYLTPNGQKDGKITITFTDGKKHIVTGIMYKGYHAPAYPECNIANLRVEGAATYNDWELIADYPSLRPVYGVNSDFSPETLRTLWFDWNTKPYARIKLSWVTNHGGPYTGFHNIGIIETNVPGLDRNDFALVASEENPFVAYIACGTDMETGKMKDHRVVVKENVVIDSRILDEMETNQLYLVPAKADGSLPDYCDPLHAKKINNDTWLVADYRRVHYGNREKIREMTYVILPDAYSWLADPIPVNADFGNKGYYDFRWRCGNANGVHNIQDSHRGTIGSFDFRTRDAWLANNYDLTRAAPFGSVGHHMSTEMTIEFDVKCTGASESTNIGDYEVLFDGGYNSASSLVITYHRASKTIVFHSTNHQTGWSFQAPCDLNDNKWHNLAFSFQGYYVYIHLDGKCILRNNNCIIGRGAQGVYNSYTFGRWLHYAGYGFMGRMKNIRIVIGRRLYGSRDFTVSETFSRDLIPDKSLHYDQAVGVMKEYSVATGKWKEVPMLPVGTTKTDFLGSVYSDERQGIGGTSNANSTGQGCKRLFTHMQSGNWSNREAKNLLNRSSFSRYLFTTPNENREFSATIGIGDVDGRGRGPSAPIITTAPSPGGYMKAPIVGKLRMWPNQADIANWQAESPCFALQGSDDAVTWETLVDRLTYREEGRLIPNRVLTNWVNPTWIPGYKEYDVPATKAYWYYRLILKRPPTGRYSQGNYYCTAGISLIWKDAKPDLESVWMVPAGDTWISIRRHLAINTDLYIHCPWDNNDFTIDGWVEVHHDWHHTKRKIGQQNGWYNNGQYVSGEVVYHGRMYGISHIVISPGNYMSGVYTGQSWNLRDADTESTRAFATVIAKRVGV